VILGAAHQPLRVDLIDPSAYTRPYDHALASALAAAGAAVRLVTSEFAYGPVPAPERYTVAELFYRHARGPAGSTLRLATKAAEHVPDMLGYRRLSRSADIAHFQWLAMQLLDEHLLPRCPVVLTAHDLLPREPRRGQVGAQRRLYDRVGAVICHSEYGRGRLIDTVGVNPAKVHVIPHGAFTHLAGQSEEAPLPPEFAAVAPDRPVVLLFGLLRPYKGLDVLLDAWDGLGAEAELWIIGRARMDISAARGRAPGGVRFLERFVSDAELPAFFRRADLVVAPYTESERFDQSGVVATALAFGTPMVLSAVGGFGDVAAAGAARLVPAGDAGALADALSTLIGDRPARAALAAGARAAAAERFSWGQSAQLTLAVYESLLSG
jgi:glycosyltransferase involved in cell wall biosynthesis